MEKFTNEQLARKIIGNSFYPDKESAKCLHPMTFYMFNQEKVEEMTKIGREKVREYKKFAEMYDELTNIAKKYNCTIILPTQPNCERNYKVIQELKDNPDILVIDYFDKI